MQRSSKCRLIVTGALCAMLMAKEGIPAGLNQIETAQAAIRTFFPELTGKQYPMFVFWGNSFDHTWTTVGLFRRFSLEVQDSASDFLKGETFESRGTGLLNAVFEFDSSDLTMLSIQGRANRYRENTAIRNLVDHHKEWSDQQVIDALKDAGALYGPNDEQELRRVLPTMSKLASIFGAAPTITAASFELRADLRPPAPRNASLDWRVDLRVPSRGGRKKGTRYIAGFEPFAGKLNSIVRLEN